jgi:predicted Ser/Thr protein kinase
MEAVPVNIPNLAARIKEISKKYNDNAPVNNFNIGQEPLFRSMKPFIRAVALKSQTNDPAYWASAGIRMEDPVSFKACVENVKEKTKVLGQGYYGKVFNVPANPCIKHLPKGVKHIGVKVESLKPDVDENQTPDRLKEVTMIAKKAGMLQIGPKMYDSFVTVGDDGLVQIIKVFEIIDGTSWMNTEWKSEKAKKNALEKVTKLIHQMNKAGIIHHDLHSGNVMISKTGRVYIIDFDLAKLVENEESDRLSSFTGLNSWGPKGVLSDKGIQYIYTKLIENGSIKVNNSAKTLRATKSKRNNKTKKYNK